MDKPLNQYPYAHHVTLQLSSTLCHIVVHYIRVHASAFQHNTILYYNASPYNPAPYVTLVHASTVSLCDMSNMML